MDHVDAASSLTELDTSTHVRSKLMSDSPRLSRISRIYMLHVAMDSNRDSTHSVCNTTTLGLGSTRIVVWTSIPPKMNSTAGAPV